MGTPEVTATTVTFMKTKPSYNYLGYCSDVFQPLIELFENLYFFALAANIESSEIKGTVGLLTS